jgi:hypothetical protein
MNPSEFATWATIFGIGWTIGHNMTNRIEVAICCGAVLMTAANDAQFRFKRFDPMSQVAQAETEQHKANVGQYRINEVTDPQLPSIPHSLTP